MKSIKNLSRLSKQLRLVAKSAAALTSLAWTPFTVLSDLGSDAGRIVEVDHFGSNPGALGMLTYRPQKRLRAAAPLIVVMHGCGQDAENFARNAGWVGLSERLGIPLVIPVQSAKNNHSRCFNWHNPGDTRRNCGEAMSVRQMVRAAIARYGSDRRKVFIVGLSAGGAMTAALLAAYPAVFAGGAIAAGMSVGAASLASTALFRMHRANQYRSRIELADAVRSASPRRVKESWPRLSIWQGEEDRLIDPANAEVLAQQWSALHGYDETPASDSVTIAGARRRCWGSLRRPAVELWTIAEMGHGFPVDVASEDGTRTGFGVIDAKIPAASLIARFWGLTD